ncbi:hypothetical protein [Streptomyces sp. NPDC001307]|uniref:hypothetical protein n=1 Tax=Streptomyces sp. NPDC001307 TaxID=3364560 RepID=UPI0036942D96
MPWRTSADAVDLDPRPAAVPVISLKRAGFQGAAARTFRPAQKTFRASAWRMLQPRSAQDSATSSSMYANPAQRSPTRTR